MPEMIPVGNTITPPNPQQGLGMLSGLIGVQQQRQALQTGQYQQQTAAAQAQQQQLAASQQQGVQSFFNSWDPSQHIADDGTTDLDSALQSKEFQSAGNAKPAIMQALLDVKTKQLANKQALAGLNSTVITQLGTQAGALAKDPDVVDDKTDPATGINPGRAKVSELINNFSKLSPDNARVAQQMFNVDKVPQGKLSTAVQALQMRAQSASEQQTAQFPKQIAVSAGANTQLFNVQPSQGIQPGQQPVASVPYVTPPANMPNAAGQIIHVAPGGAGLPSTATPPAATGGLGVNPTQPQVSSATQLATTDSGRYAQVSQEGTNAQTGAQLADQVANLAKQVQTGKLSQEWADNLAVLQQHDPRITARQMLSKYAAQLKTMAESNAATDQSKSQIEQGMPSPEKMDPDAIQEASQYVGGIFRMRGARQQVADQYKQTNGSTMGLTGTDDAFTRAADPLVFAYNALPAGKQRQDFLGSAFKGNPDAIRAFIARKNQVQHYVGQQ